MRKVREEWEGRFVAPLFSAWRTRNMRHARQLSIPSIAWLPFAPHSTAKRHSLRVVSLSFVFHSGRSG